MTYQTEMVAAHERFVLLAQLWSLLKEDTWECVVQESGLISHIGILLEMFKFFGK